MSEQWTWEKITSLWTEEQKTFLARGFKIICLNDSPVPWSWKELTDSWSQEDKNLFADGMKHACLGDTRFSFLSMIEIIEYTGKMIFGDMTEVNS